MAPARLEYGYILATDILWGVLMSTAALGMLLLPVQWQSSIVEEVLAWYNLGRRRDTRPPGAVTCEVEETIHARGHAVRRDGR